MRRVASNRRSLETDTGELMKLAVVNAPSYETQFQKVRKEVSWTPYQRRSLITLHLKPHRQQLFQPFKHLPMNHIEEFIPNGSPRRRWIKQML
jgi:hypothetical protein